MSLDMENTSQEPIPRTQPKAYQRKPLPHGTVELLPPPVLPNAPFRQVLGRRRSGSEFLSANRDELSSWLHLTASTQAIDANDPNRQLRYAPSPGALHPAQVVLGFPGDAWSVYLAGPHGLGDLAVNPEASSLLHAAVSEIYPRGRAVVVLLLSDADLLDAYYAFGDILLYRDAGVLQGHAALAAAALGLSYRILGSLGRPWSEQLIAGVPFRAVATGLALLGGNPASRVQATRT